MPSQEEYDELTNLLFNPSGYREAFKANAEDGEEPEIFEILRKQIIDYAKETPSFKNYLIDNLDLRVKSASFSVPRSSVGKSVSRFSSKISRSAMFSPRSSSRPMVD